MVGRRRLLVALLTVAAVLAVGCSTTTTPTLPPPPSPVADTIKIGVEGPMSGDQSVTGIDMWNAANLAADAANANGGVAGKQIELVRLDDAADPEVGKTVAEQAVAEGVFAVVGPYNSSVGIENLDIYLKAGIIPIHLTSTDQTDGQGYTIQPKDYQVAPVEAAAISGWLHQKTAAILVDATQDYTWGIANQLNDILKEEKVKVVLWRKVSSKRPPAALISEVNAVDAGITYSSTFFPEGSQIAQVMLRHSDSECFMGLANQDPEFIERAGIPASENCYFSGVPSPDQFPAAADYVTEYTQRFTTPPGTWGPFVYDSMNLLFAAVEESGTWDQAAVDQNLKATVGFEGITGPIDIDPTTGARPNVPIVILKVTKDGKFIVNPGWAKWAGFATS